MEEKGGATPPTFWPKTALGHASVLCHYCSHLLCHYVRRHIFLACRAATQPDRPGSAALSSVAVNQPNRRRSVAEATVAIATSDAVVRNVVKSSAPEWKASTAAKRIHLGRLSLYGSGAIGRERCDAREIYA